MKADWRTAAWAAGWAGFGVLDGALNQRHDGSTLSERVRALDLPDWLLAGLLGGGASALYVHLKRRSLATGA